jgi:hypothetical protein
MTKHRKTTKPASTPTPVSAKDVRKMLEQMQTDEIEALVWMAADVLRLRDSEEVVTAVGGRAVSRMFGYLCTVLMGAGLNAGMTLHVAPAGIPAAGVHLRLRSAGLGWVKSGEDLTDLFRSLLEAMTAAGVLPEDEEPPAD